VQDTLTPIYTTWGAAVGQDAVYSAMNIDDAGQYFATTIDFSTGEQRILCKKLGCSHTDESCPAYMTAIRNGCVPQKPCCCPWATGSIGLWMAATMRVTARIWM
jgi:hypothetical protein